MTILKGKRYSEELYKLVRDPIMHAMYAGLIEHGMSPKQLSARDGWSWINQCSQEYHNRGGKVAFSIGGPASALILLEEGTI